MDAEKNINDSYRQLITSTLLQYGVMLFGIADLSGIPTIRDTSGDGFPSAITFALTTVKIVVSARQSAHLENEMRAQIELKTNN